MTIDETRLLAVEFERRVNTIDPTTESVNKLDTDTIYSYLNQYQSQYIQQIYLAQDSKETGKNTSIRLEDALKDLVCHASIYPAGDRNSDMVSEFYELPDDYYIYIRSNSIVTGTYKNFTNAHSVPNTFVKQSDVSDVILSYYNTEGIIRNPLVALNKINIQAEKGQMQVIHDKYTNIHKIEIVYYKQPNRFNIIDNLPCELSYECFDDLVSGAVELYFSYKYKVSLASEAARRNRRRKEREEDE